MLKGKKSLNDVVYLNCGGGMGIPRTCSEREQLLLYVEFPWWKMCRQGGARYSPNIRLKRSDRMELCLNFLGGVHYS